VLKCQGNPGLGGGACSPTTGTLQSSEAMPLIRTGQREGVPLDDVRTLPWVMAQVWSDSRREQLREAHRRWGVVTIEPPAIRQRPIHGRKGHPVVRECGESRQDACARSLTSLTATGRCSCHEPSTQR
jgi:hypothetical protein